VPTSTTTATVTSADGTRIALHSQGDGPPVLFVHGTLATIDMYRPIANLLAPRYRVVMMVRRNYGGSGTDAGPSTLTRQAEDVLAVLDTLDAPAFVFAHSFGGLAALHAAILDGSRIGRLALYEPPVIFAGDVLVPVRDTCRELVAAGRSADAVLHFLAATSEAPTRLGVGLRALAVLLRHRAGGLLADLECMTGPAPDPDRWAAIGGPTLLLTGADSDRYGRQSTDVLRRTLPDSRTVVLPGLGHQPDDPVPVADALREFFVPAG
jgi:pimeloyl-ACP methyl ester carboxylesterase